MSGIGGGENMRAGIKRGRRLVTIPASGFSPPRLNGAVSLSAEPIKAYFKEYGSYKHNLLRDRYYVQG